MLSTAMVDPALLQLSLNHNDQLWNELMRMTSVFEGKRRSLNVECFRQVKDGRSSAISQISCGYNIVVVNFWYSFTVNKYELTGLH